jgi:hypothetical protein
MSILRYNFRQTLEDHDSVQRTYALNDESALLICDYGKAERPRIPFPYYAEAWTGLEYMAGAQLMYSGMVAEGVRIFENARRRHDGEKRNAWDEPECGHHYARAMSAWSGIAALSGFLYSGPERRVSVIWSTATGWGTCVRTPAHLTISVLHGSLPCGTVEVGGSRPRSISLNGRTLPHDAQGSVIRLREAVEVREGSQLEIRI